MVIPDIESLRAFVRAVLATDGIPVAIRNECHRLLLAAETNDADVIQERVERIQRLAAEAGITIPVKPFDDQ